MQHNNETVTVRGVRRDEQGQKRVEKVEVPKAHGASDEALKYAEKKLIDKGVHRKDRQPVDGMPLNRQTKAGHGGKYTWEGPASAVANEMEEAPVVVLDENDPNYIDEEAEGSAVAGLVVGEVDIPKLAEEGVARVDVDPKLMQPNV